MYFAETRDDDQSTLDMLLTYVGYVRDFETAECDSLAIDKPYEFVEQDHTDPFALLV